MKGHSGLFKNTRGDIQYRLRIIQQKLDFVDLLNYEIEKEIEDLKAAIRMKEGDEDDPD